MSAAIETKVGFADAGENHFCGHRVRDQLAGKSTWASLMALAVGAPAIDAAAAAMIDDAATCTLAADPRIWPLKVTRLVSSYGGTLAGFCAGHMLLEEAIMGPWPTSKSAELLLEIRSALAGDLRPEAVAAWVDGELARGRKLAGFGVPFRPADERVAALSECVERRGRSEGPMWSLAMTLDRLLYDRKKVHGNQSLALGALFLDLGFTPPQISVLTTAILDLCFYANAIEEAQLRSPSLRTLPSESVAYVGRPRVTSPRALAKKTLDSQSPMLAEPVYR
ncbi:MAG TPA: hypothetical protein VH054_09510 [Polyangiaceae bacterium]|nr:hypothetical protein [Polyangiaceae bacterium]